MKIAIITTSEARYIEALAEAVKNRVLDVEISLIITNKPNSRAIGVSAMYGIPCEFIDHNYFSDREEHDKEIMKKLDEYGIDLVVLAGYMRIIKSREFLEKYARGMINVHNSLLPEYPGAFPHRTAFKEGMRKSGYTIHFVNGFVDGGKIISQGEVDISGCENEKEVYDKLVIAGCTGLKRVINDFSIDALLMKVRE
jgi:phosphoribosylglycinamide formyltransferase 1